MSWSRFINTTSALLIRSHDPERIKSFNYGIYKASLILLACVVSGLFSMTMIDILPQSLANGQFWNAIIVITAVCITVVLGFGLYIFRIIRSRRWLAATPRKYMIGRRDMPRSAYNMIQASRTRSQHIMMNQYDRTVIKHDGLQNPESKEPLRIEAPFTTVLEMLPIFLQREVLLIDPTFARSKSQDLRMYLDLLLSYGLLDKEHLGLAANFNNMYEPARFSGKPISEDELLQMIAAFCDLVQAIQEHAEKSLEAQMEPARRRPSSSAISIASVGSGDSVIVRPIEGDWLSSVARQESIAAAIRRASSVAYAAQMRPNLNAPVSVFSSSSNSSPALSISTVIHHRHH